MLFLFCWFYFSQHSIQCSSNIKNSSQWELISFILLVDSFITCLEHGHCMQVGCKSDLYLNYAVSSRKVSMSKEFISMRGNFFTRDFTKKRLYYIKIEIRFYIFAYGMWINNLESYNVKEGYYYEISEFFVKCTSPYVPFWGDSVLPHNGVFPKYIDNLQWIQWIHWMKSIPLLAITDKQVWMGCQCESLNGLFDKWLKHELGSYLKILSLTCVLLVYCGRILDYNTRGGRFEPFLL